MGASMSVVLGNYEYIITKNNLSAEVLRNFYDINSVKNFLEDIGIDDSNVRELITRSLVENYDEIFTKGTEFNHSEKTDFYNSVVMSDRIYHCISNKNLEEEKVRNHVEVTSSCEQVPIGGITIRFLVDFCNRYDLWNLSTREVCRFFVKPMTSGLRCSFVQLPFLQGSGNVGKAVTFISHTWGSKFGDLVAAVSDGADYNRKVWIDVFARCHWSSLKVDAEIVKTVAIIRQCTSFVLVCSSYPEIVEMNELDVLHRNRTAVSAEILNKVSLFRKWCLYELYSAIMTPDMSIILKGGSFRLNDDKKIASQSHCFIVNRKLLWVAQFFVDFEQASVTNPADRPLLTSEISASPGGINGLNSNVQGFVCGSYCSSGYPKVQCAACGDSDAISEVIRHKTRYIHAIAGCGYHLLLEKVVSHCEEDAESLINCRDVSGMTPLLWSAQGGHVACVQYLIAQSCDLTAKNRDGITAMHAAALGGYDRCLQMLMESGCDINAQYGGGTTPLMAASLGGHLSCVIVLVAQASCDITIVDDHGQDAVAYAMEGNMLARVPPEDNDDENGDGDRDGDDGRCVTEVEYCHPYGECIKVISAKFEERALQEKERIRELELEYLKQFD